MHEQQVWRFLRAQQIDLDGRKSWCESQDPDFVAKADDVVGLYIAPPENAVVICVDEKPSIQALERAQGYLKLPNGRTLTGHSHDCKRNGTSTLFATFEVATGKVMATHKNRRRRVEFLDFMNRGRTMRNTIFRVALRGALFGLALSSAAANQATAGDAAAIAAAQAVANEKPGPRTVSARVLPVPSEGVSPQMQAYIAAPYLPFFNADPKTSEDWRALVSKVYELQAKRLPGLRAALGVSVEPVTIAGVKAFEIVPASIPEANRHRVILHMHGGGYVFNPGETGTVEGMMIASYGGFRVVSVDYRMPPDSPYPAALDDCISVWRELAKTTPPQNIGLIGTSTGGALVLSTVLRAKEEKLPLPGAIASGTPWADLTKTGDSYFSNEWVDNILVTWDGWLGRAAFLYASGRDLRDPYLSPAYGDMSGFPPTILTTGTRDLFLSNTVRVHRKLRRAGVPAELNVYEGMSHGIYQDDPSMPESREVYADIARFFDQHLGKE